MTASDDRDVAACAALTDKYARLVRLRSPEVSAGDPRPEMRAVASTFPGALRELDELPLSVLEARLAEVRAWAAAEAPTPGWAWPMLELHGWLRVALRAKRAAGRDRSLPLARAALTVPRQVGDPPAVDDADLAAILHPPRGRLNRWLLGRVAARHGLEPEALERLLFPPSPQRLAAHAHRQGGEP